jgi:Na+-transporting NADH:ubiquinone oxidoreductase subunit C
LEVIKGVVSPDSPKVNFEVDGISGATITSKGVTNLIRYWLGSDAFGPYLERLRRQEEGANRG